MKTILDYLEERKVISKPSPVLTLIYCTIITLFSGYLYLYSLFAPQISERLNLTPVETSTLTMALLIGSSFGGIGIGIIVDTFGTEFATLVGGGLTFLSFFTLRICYDYQINNIILLGITVCTLGLSSIIGNIAALKVVNVNFPKIKGTASGIVASGFAISALTLSNTVGKIFEKDISGLLLCLAILNGLVISLGVFFAREIPPDFPLGAELVEDNNDEEMPEDFLSPLMESSTSGFEDNSGAYSILELENEQECQHHATYNYHSGHNKPFWEKLINNVRNLELYYIFCSRFFWVNFGIIAFATSLGQGYIFTVGYLVVNQYHNPNYEYNEPQETFQNIQVSQFSLFNFFGRFVAGFCSDYIVTKLHLQRQWIFTSSFLIFIIAQFILYNLNNLELLTYVSMMNGFAFGIIYGSLPSVVSDYYSPNIYSLVWGTITTGAFVGNTMISDYFLYSIQSNGSYNPETGKYICESGVSCYHKTYYLTFAFCVFGLLFLFYNIWYKRQNIAHKH